MQEEVRDNITQEDIKLPSDSKYNRVMPRVGITQENVWMWKKPGDCQETLSGVSFSVPTASA